ncbi:MAG: hypothetical protein Q4E73_07430 [Lachnospiraceae bacterium]|nr:hypothetical protein [Lachnospiraceae bacterium]
MKEIINEYGEYIVSFIAAVGILALLYFMMDILKSAVLIFADSLC